MVGAVIDYDNLYEDMWKQAKGSMKLGDFNMDWDLTDGMTKKEFIRERRKIFEPQHIEIVVTKSGRILIPSMGIY